MDPTTFFALWIKDIYRYGKDGVKADTLNFAFEESLWNMQGQFLLRDRDEDGTYYFENMGWMMAFDFTQRAVFDAEGHFVESAYKDSIPIPGYHSLQIFDDYVWDNQGRGYFPVVGPEGIEVWRYGEF